MVNVPWDHDEDRPMGTRSAPPSPPDLVAENARLEAEVKRLKPFEEELMKIAADVGEPDDPFAAWEVITFMKESLTYKGPEVDVEKAARVADELRSDAPGYRPLSESVSPETAAVLDEVFNPDPSARW